MFLTWHLVLRAPLHSIEIYLVVCCLYCPQFSFTGNDILLLIVDVTLPYIPSAIILKYKSFKIEIQPQSLRTAVVEV